MILTIALFSAALLVSYANGANDNFKGVATLFGSRTAGYKACIWWATITTLLGSLFSVALAGELIKAFSGKGLVPATLAGSPEFLLPVALGAGGTVLLATFLGFPISTTHSLIGALVGAGAAANWSGLSLAALSGSFVAPLAVSPLVAAALAATVYTGFRFLRVRTGVTKESCLCVGPEEELALAPAPVGVGALAFENMKTVKSEVSLEGACEERYLGRYFGLNAQKTLDTAHFLSAGLVSFARGLNDTPKIMGLLLVVSAFDIHWGMLAIAVAMALGGLLNARKVAGVMSNDITGMNHGQGFSANLVTGALVIFASKLGMPVSTTHVSVGSLFGIGAVNRRANYSVIGRIALSWALTLPMAAILAAVAQVIFFS